MCINTYIFLSSPSLGRLREQNIASALTIVRSIYFSCFYQNKYKQRTRLSSSETPVDLRRRRPRVRPVLRQRGQLRLRRRLCPEVRQGLLRQDFCGRRPRTRRAVRHGPVRHPRPRRRREVLEGDKRRRPAHVRHRQRPHVSHRGGALEPIRHKDTKARQSIFLASSKCREWPIPHTSPPLPSL